MQDKRLRKLQHASSKRYERWLVKCRRRSQRSREALIAESLMIGVYFVIDNAPNVNCNEFESNGRCLCPVLSTVVKKEMHDMHSRYEKLILAQNYESLSELLDQCYVEAKCILGRRTMRCYKGFNQILLEYARELTDYALERHDISP